jgi:zinc protease
VAMEAKIQQPQLHIAYPSPPNFAPGDRELDLLANLLGNGKSSRLFKRLVYDLKIAQAVSAAQNSQLLASDFELTASPMPGHTVDEILAVIDEEIAGLQAKPVEPAELERAKNQIESETVRSLEGLQARAERLQHYNLLVGDPGFVTEDLRRYRAVDAAAVQRIAQQVLRKDGRVVITVAPNPDAPIMGRVKP